MRLSHHIRQFHRWMSALFTLAVLAIFIGMSVRDLPEWVYLVPLAPLGLLFLTGLWMFLLPYLVKGPAPDETA